jgi:plasmid stabilization system protein ParE
VTITVRLRDEAGLDLAEAASWYESQRVGLGHEFLDSVLEALDLIRENPEAYPIVHRSTHRVVLSRFPFAVFYRITESEIVVISIMHGSRHPARWKTRT